MASVDKSSNAEHLDDDKHDTDSSSSCLNDPNYAIICVFLQKFGSQLKIEHPNFLRLQKMIENTDEVHDELRQFFVKLLRKIRKSVQPDKVDSALAKFCYTYSAQDAWEVERFGYKKSSLAVKLRILKELLECQFDKNPNFRTLIQSQTALELRSQPLGKDRLGNAYWSTIDEQCNLRIYQEHLDEEIWKVVATNRDEMVKLISCLRGNELVMPSLIGLIDEDSSSNSMPPKVDALENETENGTANGTTNVNDNDDKNVPCLKIKLNTDGGESTVEQIANSDNTNGAKTQSQNSVTEEDEDGEEEEDASIMSEIDELSVAASESSTTTAGTKSNETHGSKRISLLASKPPQNKLKLRIFATDKKSLKRNLDVDSDSATGKNKRPTMRNGADDDDSEFDSEEMSDEELDENEISADDEVGPAIEEPTMYVEGNGSGAANQCENIFWADCEQFDEHEVSEAIEEEIFYVFGNGSGHDCDVGNNDIKTTETPASSTTAPQPTVQTKPMFFFGQAGCLKLSPMKPVVTSDKSTDSSDTKNDTTSGDSDKVQNESEKVESEKLENDKIESEKINDKKNDETQESSSVVHETATNDTNSVALDAKSESVVENAMSNDEIDKGISICNESSIVVTPSNNIEEKIEQREENELREKKDQNEKTKHNEQNEQNEQKEQNEQNESNDQNQTSSDLQSSEIKSLDGIEAVDTMTNENDAQSEPATSSSLHVDADDKSVKGNIESNSSVALESVSVQEENKAESPQNDSELLAKPESHLLNDELKGSEINDNSIEVQSSTAPETQKTGKEFDESCESTTIDSIENVSGTNVLEIQTQSNLSQETESNVDGIQMNFSSTGVISTETQSIDASDNDKTNEIPNQIVDSMNPVGSNTKKNSDEMSDEANYSGQVPVVEEIIVPKKAYICGPEEKESSSTNIQSLANDINAVNAVNAVNAHDAHQTDVQTKEPKVNDLSNLVVNISNIEEKTESLSEQAMNDKSTIDENTVELQVETKKSNETEMDAIKSHNVECVNPQSISLETTANLPNQIEMTNESASEKATVEIDLPVEKNALEPIVEQIETTEKCSGSKEKAITKPSVSEFTIEPETIVVQPIVDKPIESKIVEETNKSIEPSESVCPLKCQTVESIIGDEQLSVKEEHFSMEKTKPEKAESQQQPVTEKRKRFDTTEQPTECKKVCEEHVALNIQQTSEIAVNLALEQEKHEIPSISEIVSKPTEIKEQQSLVAESKSIVEIESKSAVEQFEKIETLEPTKSFETISSNDEPTKILSDYKKSESEDIASDVVVPPMQVNKYEKESLDEESGSQKPNELNTSLKVSAKIAEESSIEIPTRKSTRKVASKSNDKESTPPPPPAVEVSRGIQLRNRKRRISTEKTRHTSESDDNIDALIESPLSQQDASSDEEVGGKRIKMRPKTVKRTLRKSVEQKRNIKDTEWSSDENDKPNAKRATSELPKKDAEKIESTVKQIAPELEDDKTTIKDEKLLSEQHEADATAAADETKIKEEELAEQQSEEEKATQSRRGRPGRRSKKPGPKPKPKPVADIKVEKIKDEKPKPDPIEEKETVKDEKSETVSTPGIRRKKRSLLGLDMADVESIQAAADETPVRQSRRIAQIKIKEEAERRKAEEVALQKMKEASEKKKKGVVQKLSESEEENSESEAKLEKKKRRKKGNKDKPWQTDSDDSSERDEEEVYEHEDVERLPPLRSDHEFSPESDIEDESQIVPTKRARTARKDKTERREESSEEEEDIHACQKCGKSDHPEWILLCDKCDKGYHCSCLIPVLFVIPEGNWFCPPCQQEKLIDTLEGKLLEFDNLIKQKEIEEAQRQRLLLTTISEANVIQDTKRDRQRARAHDFDDSDVSSDNSSSEDSENETKPSNQERRTRPRPNRQRHITESSEQSSSDNTSDNEPIYKLRKRRQANVSYRFNEYDELINRAIKSEMDEVAGAGNLGRGKDITTIMEADKEEKRLKKLEQEQKERELTGDSNEKKDDDDSDDQPLKTKGDNSDGSESEPIRPKAIKRAKNISKKKKKLNSLDVDSEEDVDSSDDDFKGDDSYTDEEEEDDDSTPDSESSLDSIVKKKRKNRGISTRRSVRERKKRYDADFIDDSSFDDEDNKPLVKKKKKVESDYSDFDGSSEEIDEDVDSEDLCDDSTDDSDKSWGKRKKKPTSKGKEIKTQRKKKPDGERSFKGKSGKKKPKVSDDESDDDDEDEYADEVLPKSRRTRGKKLPYLLDDDFDSSDDGIKPGVKRPDTPPEERAAFIKKQEEIKRMLAEKRDETSEKIPPPVKGSLSTIPPQIIQSAKALDVDLKKTAALNRNASDNDSNGFDDDLPEDFDPEDMDEDAIAKMMEEEEFAQHQLKLAGETIRNRKLKDALTEPLKKDDSPTKLSIETSPSVILPPNIPPSLISPLPIPTSQLTIPDIPASMYTAQFQGAHSKMATPKKRGRKIKDDLSPILPAKESTPAIPQPSPALQLPTIQHTSILPPINKPNTLLNISSVLQTPPSQLFSSPTIQHTASVIAHSSVIQQQQQQQQPQQRPPPSLPPQQRSLPPMPSNAMSSILGLGSNREPIIPSTVLDVQNTRLLDPSELGKPPDDLIDPAAKKRARRKKVTPTRESLITSPPNAIVSPGISQPVPVTIPNVSNVTKAPTSILSERLTANPVEKPGLSIATPPQLYSPSSRSQASVITRLARPSQRQPFPSGQSSPQRYYAPNSSVPPHSIPTTGSHSRPYHAPNVTVSSGPRPPLVPPPHSSGHLPHPMYMRGQPGIYGGYPNIQPPPMHRSLQTIEHTSNSPQNFTGPYQNLPFGSYYAAAAAAERRSGAIIGSFEPFDNKTPSSHDRLPAYAHPGLGLAALASRNLSSADGGADDERSGAPPSHGGGSEFSGLVSYFSSQQDDLDP